MFGLGSGTKDDKKDQLTESLLDNKHSESLDVKNKVVN